MSKKPTQLELLYFQVTDLWRMFCEKHADLFDLTSEEYNCLIENNLDQLDIVIEQKQEIIEYVGNLEELRLDLIGKVNLALANESGKKHSIINSISQLLKVMSDVSPEKEGQHLFKFNTLLIDIIEKIQDQNKKNQIFINKAIDSLKSIREDATGEKKCSVYTSTGRETTHTGSINLKR
ncbi:MAG: flagellar export chaperone FlgN [Bacteriovoracaceae bacterium]|nr:flagellar export chaperone FlgN [Bacteriovoracaceae bacterium]